MKKTAYISINMAEHETLMTKASFAEITMYLILKKLANFKTGHVGGFRQQKLNYEKLAQMVSRPTRNTAPAEIYDRNQARNLVLRLEKIGLVSQVVYEGEALKMRLHLSPMGDYEEDETDAGNTGKPVKPVPASENVGKCHQERTEFSLDFIGEFDQDCSAISTDSPQYKKYNHHSHIDSTDVLDQYDQGEGTSPSVATGGTIHPFPIFEKIEGKSAQLTKEHALEHLKAAGFRLLDHPVSQNIVGGWVKAGLRELDLKAAIYSLSAEGGDLVPGELDREIRPLMKTQKKNGVASSTGRGRVAL